MLYILTITISLCSKELFAFLIQSGLFYLLNALFPSLSNLIFLANTACGISELRLTVSFHGFIDLAMDLLLIRREGTMPVVSIPDILPRYSATSRAATSDGVNRVLNPSSSDSKLTSVDRHSLI